MNIVSLGSPGPFAVLQLSASLLLYAVVQKWKDGLRPGWALPLLSVGRSEEQSRIGAGWCRTRGLQQRAGSRAVPGGSSWQKFPAAQSRQSPGLLHGAPGAGKSPAKGSESTALPHRGRLLNTSTARPALFALLHCARCTRAPSCTKHGAFSPKPASSIPSHACGCPPNVANELWHSQAG